jgi:hypothetical protein
VSGLDAETESLRCPSCGATFTARERFCGSCRVPLVRGPAAGRVAEPVSDRHARARKVKPQLGEGRLVKVAGARNQAEAEFIQGLLLEEGVPSLLRRSAGFDVPDFLAAGPRDVLVPETGAATAREVLLEAQIVSRQEPRPVIAPVRLLAALVIALAVGVLLVWLAVSVVR